MTEFLAHTSVDDERIRDWVGRFHRDGYLFLQNILPPETVSVLRADLDDALEGLEPRTDGSRIELHHRMFESSPTNLSLFDLEPIVTFAETLIAADCHVFHNNGFRTPTGGGIITWHQDDPPHYVVTDGRPPTNVHLPVLFFTANYYLTDVEAVENGPTQVIRESHLLGAEPPNPIEGSGYEDRVVSCLGPAGSVVMFNNQVWHRGAPNTSDRVRYMAQVSYGRRIVGHKYNPFMNYVMPEHVYTDADERRRRLLGFLPAGAYG